MTKDLDINTKIEKNNTCLDILKFICAILIVGSHSLPLFHNSTINLYYGQWFFRFCVPLFIISSGFYFQKMNSAKKLSYIKRILIIYIISTILYLPEYLTSNHFLSIIDILKLFKTILFGFYHLWYLSSLLFALIISYFIDKFFDFEKHKILYLCLSVTLLIIGIFFDEYYKIINIELLNKIAEGIKFIGSSRNFLFMALPLLTFGRYIFLYKDSIFKVKSIYYFILFALTFSLSALELLFFNYLKLPNITCDLTIFNYMPAIFLFILTFYYHPAFLNKKTTILRKHADIIYIIHIMIINIFIKLSPVQYLTRFIIVIAISWIIAFIYTFISSLIKKHIAQRNL